MPQDDLIPGPNDFAGAPSDTTDADSKPAGPVHTIALPGREYAREAGQEGQDVLEISAKAVRPPPSNGRVTNQELNSRPQRAKNAAPVAGGALKVGERSRFVAYRAVSAATLHF